MCGKKRAAWLLGACPARTLESSRGETGIEKREREENLVGGELVVRHAFIGHCHDVL